MCKSQGIIRGTSLNRILLYRKDGVAHKGMQVGRSGGIVILFVPFFHPLFGGFRLSHGIVDVDCMSTLDDDVELLLLFETS